VLLPETPFFLGKYSQIQQVQKNSLCAKFFFEHFDGLVYLFIVGYMVSLFV